jgi:hypothetical protein
MGPPTVTAPNETEAMDRIEDRLRRIEKLMTAFTPSPLSQSSSSVQYGDESTANMQQPVRQHRHSVQGISVAKEQAELRAAYESMKGMFTKKKKKPYSPPTGLGRCVCMCRSNDDDDLQKKNLHLPSIHNRTIS